MVLPRTKPLDGVFWYILDDQNNTDWRPCPNVRGDFYLGWLGQNKNVVGAGLARIQQGQLIHICTHGTPYYWLQPYEVLPFTRDTLQAQQMPGADSMLLDFSLGGWEVRDPTPPPKRPLPDASVSATELGPMLNQAIMVIVRSFRSEDERLPPSGSGTLLTRVATTPAENPLEGLLNQLRATLGEPNVLPVLVELVRHDINVMPGHRQSALFENLPAAAQLPPPNKVARLVLSAIYHLCPTLGSRRLANTLLLNSLRQRHPFDVAWGADFLVKSIGLSNLVRLLQVAALKEKDDHIRGNVLDLLQELGYGFDAGLGGEVFSNLTDLLSQVSLSAFGQVVNSHLSFMQAYMRQRDAAAHPSG
jgi:hypothetical protein